MNVLVGVIKPLNGSRPFTFLQETFLNTLGINYLAFFLVNFFIFLIFQSDPVCTDYKKCIFCQVFNKDEKEECDSCTNLNIIRVNKTIERCVLPVDENCFIVFSHETDDFSKNVTFHVVNELRKYYLFLCKLQYARNQTF